MAVKCRFHSIAVRDVECEIAPSAIEIEAEDVN
jgi:hypothetical protein